MGNRKWVSLGLAAALLVFGAGVAVGKVTDAYRPISSGNYGFFNGNDLYGYQQATQLGYVAGVVDAFRAVIVEEIQMGQDGESDAAYRLWLKVAAVAMDENEIGSLSYLADSFPPSNVTVGQLTDLVVAYLRDHPDERQNSAALLVWRALAQAEWK